MKLLFLTFSYAPPWSCGHVAVRNIKIEPRGTKLGPKNWVRVKIKTWFWRFPKYAQQYKLWQSPDPSKTGKWLLNLIRGVNRSFSSSNMKPGYGFEALGREKTTENRVFWNRQKSLFSRFKADFQAQKRFRIDFDDWPCQIEPLAVWKTG